MAVRLFLALIFAPTFCFAQALIVTNDDQPLPRTWRPGQEASFTITTLDVNARVRDRGAEVTVSQTFRNDSKTEREVQFLFPLPVDAAIDGMTLLVDGKEFPAELLDADKARGRYESIVAAKKDPALLEFVGGQVYQTRVFPVPAGAERTVTVHYTRLLPSDFGMAELTLPLSATKLSSKPVSNVAVRVSLEADFLSSLYSPSHPVTIERPTPTTATVVWKAENIVPDDDFQLLADLRPREGEIGGQLLTYRPSGSEDGYFLFLATPTVAPADDADKPAAKTVLFVLDRSGSMTGVKIGQARDAVQFVLKNLVAEDAFNLLTFADQNDLFRPELQQAKADVVSTARAFTAGVAAGGGTDINGALAEALRQVGDGSQPTYLLLLTDGQPTSGEENPARIAANFVNGNTSDIRLISFGVGEDVNSKLLDRLSTENNGFSEYVRPSDSIETAVANVFRRITSPVLVDAALTFQFATEPAVTPTNFVYPGRAMDLFAGQELVVVGRYRASGDATAVLKGRVGDTPTEYQFPVTFADESRDTRLAFIEKLWATRRIGDLINQIDLNGKNDELVQELVALSTKHGILTPYTSFLADEETNVSDVASNSLRSLELLDGLNEETGGAGFGQRGVKNLYFNAPQAAKPSRSNSVTQKAGEFDDSLQAAPSSGGFGIGGGGGGGFGGGLGGGGGLPAETRFPSYAPADFAELTKETKEQLIVQSTPAIQDAGGQTLYRRGKRFVTTETADIDVEKEDVVTIERFTPEYFALIGKNTTAENSLLSRQVDGTELLIQLRGVTYLIK